MLTRGAQVLVNIAKRLNSLHLDGWVHRDLKPGNVLWNTRKQRWTLIDFALAARIGTEARSRLSLSLVLPCAQRICVCASHRHGSHHCPRARGCSDAWKGAGASPRVQGAGASPRVQGAGWKGAGASPSTRTARRAYQRSQHATVLCSAPCCTACVRMRSVVRSVVGSAEEQRAQLMQQLLQLMQQLLQLMLELLQLILQLLQLRCVRVSGCGACRRRRASLQRTRAPRWCVHTSSGSRR
jgi:serine/threonine protein kinase